jgi:hypothetical protein
LPSLELRNPHPSSSSNSSRRLSQFLPKGAITTPL